MAGDLVGMALDEADAGGGRDRADARVISRAAAKSSIRTLSALARGRPMATVTTGMPATSSSFSTGCDSDSGGGRITPSTLVVRKRRVASACSSALSDSQASRTRWQPARARAFERADQELAEIGGARIGVEHADMGRFAGGEAARGAVRRVIELGDRFLDGGAGGVADVLLAVDDARDGHRGDARRGRDILDRDRAPAAPARPAHISPSPAAHIGQRRGACKWGGG